jgi:hypothetical protein
MAPRGPSIKKGKRERALLASRARMAKRVAAAPLSLTSSGAPDVTRVAAQPRLTRRAESWTGALATLANNEVLVGRLRRRRQPYASTVAELEIVMETMEDGRRALSLQAASTLHPPSDVWWKKAHAEKLLPGWADGVGEDALDVTGRKSIVEYEGDVLSETQLAARLTLPGYKHTHVKLFKRQAGTKLTEAEEKIWHAIDGAAVRADVLALLTRRGAGDMCKVAHYGLGCLSDAAQSRRMNNTAVVRDGVRMFLVPLRKIEIGEKITHFYNWMSLDASEKAVRSFAYPESGAQGP